MPAPLGTRPPYSPRLQVGLDLMLLRSGRTIGRCLWGSESPFSQPRVAKSTDGGFTFTQSDIGLPDVPINRILVSPTNPNTVYAATFLGVYRSTDGGANWGRFGAGLQFVEARDLYMPPDGSFLRIATYGRSVWETQP